MRAQKMTFGRYDFANFLCFGSYAACSVVVPIVLVSLAKDLNFPLTEGGMGAGGALQLGRSIPMVATLLLCGFAAGRFGKLRSLGGSILLMSLGLLLAAWSPGYLLLFAAIAIAGMGEGVVEGLATPVIQDLHPREPGRYINFTHGFWSVGVVGTTLLAGALLLWGVSWRWILTGCAVLTLIPALFYLLPTKSKMTTRDRAKKQSSKAVFTHAVKAMKLPRFWVFFMAMFLAGGGEYCLTFWTASLIEIEFGGNAWQAGLGTAFFAGGMIVGRLGPGMLLHQKRLPMLVLLCSVIGTLLGILPPYLHTLPILFATLFFLGIVSGPFWPSIQSHCVEQLKDSDSTMLYILLSSAGVPGCGVFTCLLGIAGDRFGLRTSFFLVPLCYAGIGLLLLFDYWRYRRKQEVAA